MPNQDRRSFLATLGTGILAAAGLDAAVGCARSPAREGADSAVAAAGDSATAGAATKGGRPLGPIGVQLYTLRGEMEKDVAATLARVARIGYKEVEFAGYFNKSPKEIRATLDANGLRAPSSHIPLADFEKKLDAKLDGARTAGHEYVVVPWVDEAQRRTLDDWRRIAEVCNRSAERAKGAGLRFAYHNHDFEFTPIEGRVPYELLLAETDRSLVQLELDLYWAVKSGQDPLAWFAKYPGRFPMLHVKDSAGPPAHKQVDVGQGTIPFRRIFAQRAQAGASHFFVEEDEPSNAWATVENSYRYLAGVTV